MVDAKALYDASQKETVHNFADRRTGIKVMVLKQATWSSGSDDGVEMRWRQGNIWRTGFGKARSG
eukprot:11776723-Prorocentrum_lima.AAC.1